MNLNKLFLVVGILGFIVFALTGQVMMHHYQVESMEAGPRMLIRSVHLYLMMAAAINLALGLFGQFSNSKLEILLALIVTSAPVLMTIEFFFGTQDIGQQRPFAYYSLIAIFAIFSFLVVFRWAERLKQHFRK